MIKYQEELCDKENTVNTLTTQLDREKVNLLIQSI